MIIFPLERAYWTGAARRVQATRPDSDGSFAFLRTLPAGQYLLAWADAEVGQWQDPSFLEQLVKRAQPIALDDATTLRRTLVK